MATSFALREISREREKPLWYRFNTAIGPCTTPDLTERAEYPSREAALQAPCWHHLLTSWEIEEIHNA